MKNNNITSEKTGAKTAGRGAQILDDVLVQRMDVKYQKFAKDYASHTKRLWSSNPQIHEILLEANDPEAARNGIFHYLEQMEREILAVDSKVHTLEKSTVRECIRVLKSIFAPINEKRAEFSALETLWKLANGKADELDTEPEAGFMMEFINLFRGVAGESNIYPRVELDEKHKNFLELHGREAAEARTKILDDVSENMKNYFKRYPSGLDEKIKAKREENKKRILKYYDATEEDWNDYQWHLRKVIKDPKPLVDMIELPEDEKRAVEKATEHKIPFGITPYYLALMDQDMNAGYDSAVRAQVIPPEEYIDNMVAHKDDRDLAFDFMGEHDTSPKDLITRRYPGIAILKPFNTCAQICVYCQRNWEIDECLAPNALASRKVVEDAMHWFDEHPGVGDVLITGGDPMVMKDNSIESMLEILSKKEHVYRVRFGTRTPVVLPQRWTDELIEILKKYIEPGRRQISIVTHFEHPSEITPEAAEAVQKIRKAGMMVYNQEVFTMYNSRKFESAKLRKDLKSIGVDPYYNFNMKGKKEMSRYMVPIARILQERKEEARLLPGLDRTDEPVFNVPKLGKNHLRAWQDHKLIMIKPDGARIYEFHPWEKNIKEVTPYNYEDTPIYHYLEELAADGENLHDYRNIWFYF